MSLSWTRSIQPPSHFLKIYLNIILLSMTGSPQWSLSLKFPHQNPVHISLLPHTRYMPRPFYSFQRVDCVWNMMAHAQKPDFVFRRNGRVLLNRRGRQFSRLLAAEVCASAVVMLDTTCSEVVWRVLATHSIRQFFPTLPLPCVTVYHLVSNALYRILKFVVGSFGLYSLLLADDSILGPSYDVWE